MKKGDVIIIFIILLVGTLGLLGKFIIGQSSDEKRLIITKDKIILHDILLTDDLSDAIKIGDNTEYNIINIRNGVVKVLEADCKNQVCIKDGIIVKVGEILVCLPHKLTIEIKGKNPDVDIMSK